MTEQFILQNGCGKNFRLGMGIYYVLISQTGRLFLKKNLLPLLTARVTSSHAGASLYLVSSFFMPSSRPSTVRGNMGNSWAMVS